MTPAPVTRRVHYFGRLAERLDADQRCGEWSCYSLIEFGGECHEKHIDKADGTILPALHSQSRGLCDRSHFDRCTRAIVGTRDGGESLEIVGEIPR